MGLHDTILCTAEPGSDSHPAWADSCDLSDAHLCMAVCDRASAWLRGVLGMDRAMLVW